MASSRFDPRWAVLLIGCDEPEPRPVEVAPVEVSAIEAVVSEAVATVVTVSFETSEAVPATVVFGVDGALDRATPLTAAGTSHEAVLLGLPADTTVSYTIEVDGERTGTATVRTGAL